MKARGLSREAFSLSMQEMGNHGLLDPILN